MRKLLILLLFVSIAFSQSAKVYWLGNEPDSKLTADEVQTLAAFAEALEGENTFTESGSSLYINDVYTESAVASYKSIRVDLRYSPADGAGTAAPIPIVGKLTLDGDITAENSYPGMGWGVQGQVHLADTTTIDGSTYGSPGAVYAGLRGVITGAGTVVFTKGNVTGLYSEIQLGQANANDGADFNVYGAWIRNQGTATSTDVAAALYIDANPSFPNTFLIGIDINDAVIDIELDDGSLIDGDATNGATLSSATNVSSVNNIAGLNRSVITLSNYVMTITDAASNGGHGSLKLVDFPAGMIYVLGVIGDMSISGVGGGGYISATAVFDMALGSVATTNDQDNLDGTNVDFVAKVDGTLSGGADDIDLVTNTPQTEDGHTSTTDVWLNVAVAQGDISQSSTMTMSGTIVITWVNTGDY